MDATDVKILMILQKNARTTNAEVAGRVGLSQPSTGERIRKLEEQGIIRRYAAQLDPRKAGRDITAFIDVFIEGTRNIPGFLERIQSLPEVLECHHVAGAASYHLKVRTANTSELERLVSQDLKGIEGLRQTITAIVLSTVKEETTIDLEVPGHE